jgi:predicted AlkP superfamily pyrophosphatase or phosphodiesterase
VAWLVAGAAAQSPVPGTNRTEHLNAPYVILISLDGFRADYLDRFQLPTLQRLMRRGTRAKSMIPVFPSLTFPNHYSLVTGLFPDRHGIVGNSFYDPARRQKYSMDNVDAVRDGNWYSGEPIWVTAESQGMVAACYFWPGSEATIAGRRATLVRPYDGNTPNATRVNGVLEWLALPAERRPHVITLYFNDVDSASHRGPLGHRRIEDAARALDRALGQLLAGLDTLPIKHQVVMLVTSDHGMANTSRAQSIPIESLVSLHGVVQTFVGPVSSLHVQDGDQTRATRLRDELNAKLKNGRAYLRAEVPERHRYSANPRAGDVIVVMDEGWTLRRSYDLRAVVRPRWGAHGWDPALASMRGIFIAVGPGIRAGHVIDDVRNVDVYPLMTALLGLRSPSDLDAKPEHLRQLLEIPARLGSALERRRARRGPGRGI